MSGLDTLVGAGGVMDALGWTLVQFVWQGALVAMLLWCALALMGGVSARARYAMCCFAMALMVALPLSTFARLGGFETSGAGTRVVAPWVVSVDALGVGAGREPLGQRLMELLRVSAPVLSWVWLVGVGVFAGRLGVGLVATGRLRRVGVSPVETGVAKVFTAVAERVGVKRAVGLLESVRVEAPTVVGWLKPLVLLPACCFAGLSSTQMEALLAHELAHIRRHDYLVSVLQSVVEALLFYHPAVWWVSRQIRRERECCCDEVAAECCGDVLEYARALSWLEEQRLVGPVVGLGANGGVLHMRIRRVLGYREGSVASQVGAVAVLCAVVGGTAAMLVREAKAERMAASTTQSVTGVSTADQASAGEREAQQTSGGTAVRRTSISKQDPGLQLSPQYAKWLNEDVVWIIMPEERDQFIATRSDAERDHFIQMFWLERDDTGAPAYSFRAQHYKRVAYANAHFGSAGVPGWRTDRGRVYIVNGNPESIEAHPSGGVAEGGESLAYPFEVWHYTRPTVADKDILTFVDSCRCGVYQLTQGSGGAGASSRPAKVPSGPQPAMLHRASLALGSAAQGGVGELDGVIVDPTGAMVPRVTVVLANVQTGGRKTAQSDDEGRYSFSAPGGRYTLDAAAPGFRRTVAQNIELSAATPVHITLKLQVGGASEYVKVSGSAASSAAAQSPDRPVRISPGVAAGSVVSQAPPVYPPIAKAAHVQGIVVLHAIISGQGTVENLTVISGPQMLQAAALDAVKQWTYRPYLLNGQPVEVDTTINVNFTLGESVLQPSEPAPGASRDSGRPIRVSAGVMAGQAMSQVAPVYPSDAKAARVQGVVVLHAVVSKEGDIEDLQVVSGPQELTQSAIDAVRQWKYKPFLLNGEPVEVETTVNVNYTLTD